MVAAFWLTRLMATLLVGVRPTDPATYFGIAAFFLANATAACSIPALRVAKLQPLIALRDD